MPAPPDMIDLVEPMIPALRRYARALLRDAEESDDLVQDCLERALSRWHLRRTDGPVRSWMFTMLHNLAMNRLRSIKRRGISVPLDEAGTDHIRHEADQDHALLRGDVLSMLDHVPEDQRQVLLLVTLEDLPYADVASILGIPMGTVMSRLSRAREKLRGLMQADSAHASPVLRRMP